METNYTIPHILTKKWYYRNTGNGYYEIRNTEHALICEVDITSRLSPTRGLTPEGATRVAKAIASLPDLLEALQILLGDVERDPEKFTREEKIEIAKQAIKKATE